MGLIISIGALVFAIITNIIISVRTRPARQEPRSEQSREASRLAIQKLLEYGRDEKSNK
ncbi:hypothetical protein SDC9_150387 [bioreactor metagenome]|uniref:Uncharacterized protein n=1 Tax=bioreactor metagenome TaxID=1076179 RepID=A0A645EPG2_9ZZZZ